ncbi:hypothetical protein AAHC03_05256 [Spirometra sp. Aus1]
MNSSAALVNVMNLEKLPDECNIVGLVPSPPPPTSKIPNLPSAEVLLTITRRFLQLTNQSEVTAPKMELLRVIANSLSLPTLLKQNG